MDLREKPGKVQKCLELSLRFRLISVVLMVVLTVMFLATSWQALVTLPLGASEALGMWLAEAEGAETAWASAQYLGVSAIAMVVLFFVFGGMRSGIGGIVALLLFMGSLLFLGGAEGMAQIFFAVFAVLALILLFAAKWSVACVLFPFALAWLLLTGFVGWFPLWQGDSWLVWAVLSAAGFSSVVAFALAAGKELCEGAPRAGAMVKAGKKMTLPVLISSLLALAALTFDMGQTGAKQIAGAAILWVAYAVWFFVVAFGTMSFAPWDKLRAGSRRVQMKDKKKGRK